MVAQRGIKQKSSSFFNLTVKLNGDTLFENAVSINAGEPLYWSAVDISSWSGKKITWTRGHKGEDSINRELFDRIAMTDDVRNFIPELYQEENRPQYHFSYATGVIGDPTAMVYYEPKKEWHMFTIANPMRGREICWGHAVSTALIHWEERSPAFHYPYNIHNGVGFVDTLNLLGLNADGQQSIVLLTPIMGRPEGYISMTVSVDGGMSFLDLNDLADQIGRPDLRINPIVTGWGDAPRIYWNPVAEQFFLTKFWRLKNPGERVREKGSLQYTSTDLKSWTQIENFPLLIHDNWKGEGDANDVIELPVDGDPDNRVVLISCGRNGYALARYSEQGLNSLSGDPLSPANTIYTGHYGYPVIFSNAPGGRGIMMINVGGAYRGGIPNYELGYRPNISIPLELSIRTTPDGLRLFKNPVKELDMLHWRKHKFKSLVLSEQERPIPGLDGGLYRISTILETGTARNIHFNIMGHKLLYDVESHTFEGHEPELRPAQGRITLEILVDRTSLEVFGSEGEVFFI